MWRRGFGEKMADVKSGERFDIGKLLRGFNIFSGPALGKLIYQIIVILAVLAVCWGIWYKMFYQKTIGEQTTQHAKQIVNIEEKEDGFRVLGIEILGWRN